MLRQLRQFAGHCWHRRVAVLPKYPKGHPLAHLGPTWYSPETQDVQLPAVLLQEAQVALHFLQLKAEW